MCREARVYGRTTAAMPDMGSPPRASVGHISSGIEQSSYSHCSGPSTETVVLLFVYTRSSTWHTQSQRGNIYTCHSGRDCEDRFGLSVLNTAVPELTLVFRPECPFSRERPTFHTADRPSIPTPML